VVTQVQRETPAYAAGLNVDDEIIAIDDFRVRADQLTQRLDAYRPGERGTLLVARRDQLLRLAITFGEEPPRRWRLELDPSATAAQQQQRSRWLQPGA
jgi:predicted metalloprotease with PDZ domain